MYLDASGIAPDRVFWLHLNPTPPRSAVIMPVVAVGEHIRRHAHTQRGLHGEQGLYRRECSRCLLRILVPQCVGSRKHVSIS
jgi:hypothetical protein